MRHRDCHPHHWLIIAERALLRSFVVMTGALLIIVSLALDVTIMMLPAGLALGLTGVGLIVWGFTGDVVVG